MAHISGLTRKQYLLLPPVVEDWLPENHPAKIIDMFVESIDIKSLNIVENNEFTGRPSYEPKVMLKIILYGYSEGERSSRVLEKRTYDNLAYIWLTGNLHPDYRTIARFRQNNISQLKGLLKETLKLYKLAEVEFDGVIFTDGTKIYANASDSNIATKEKIQKLEKMAEDILKEAEEIDSKEDEKESENNKRFFKKEKMEEIKEQINKYKEEAEKKKRGVEKNKEEEEMQDKANEVEICEIESRKELEEIKEEIEKCKSVIKEMEDKDKVSLTDKDARFMKHANGHGIHMSYNAQISVDAKGVIVSAEVTNEAGDNGELLKSNVSNAEEQLKEGGKRVNKIIADAGYFETNAIKELSEKGKEVIVPCPNDYKKGEDVFNIDKFKYDESKDVYICPWGKELIFYEGRRKKGKDYLVYAGKKEECRICPLRDNCYRGKFKREVGRMIMVFKDREFLRKQKAVMEKEENKLLLKKRKNIIEPIIGFIKSRLRFRRFLLRGIEKVRGEFSIVAVVYNLMKIKRIIDSKVGLLRI